MRLRLLSYNIHKGFTSRNRKFVLDGIRQSIRETNADLVFLQEVLGAHAGHERKQDDWPREQQFEYLADSVWHHYAYGRNAVYDEGHHGNAILSKFPILSYENFDISAAEYEMRGILHCRIKITDSLEIDAYCTHLGLFQSGRTKQLEKIANWIKQTSDQTDPVILAGDFNDWRQRSCRYIAETNSLKEAHRVVNGHLARTFPSFFPLLKLDRAYFSNCTAISATALRGEPWSKLSDHTPLLVEFELPTKDGQSP